MSWKPNIWAVERGGDCQLLVILLDNVYSLPINIANATGINLLLKNADGSTLTVNAAQGMAVGLGQLLWLYSFNLTGAQTALLPLIGPVSPIQVEVEVFWGSQIQKYMISSSFSTFDPTI